MLILPDPNRLRVDFHQLCQRVLQPPRNGNGAAQGNIKLRKFFCSQLGRRIDRGARLADHHIGYLVLQFGIQLSQQLRHKDFRLLAGGPVSNGNHRHPILLNQLREHLFCLFGPVCRWGRINHRRIQHLSGGVHHRNLASGSIGRVKPHRHRSLDRRLHQQIFQVFRKHPDGLRISTLGQLRPNLSFQRWKQQPLVAVLADLPQLFCKGRVFSNQLLLQQMKRNLRICLQAHLQRLLPLSAVDGKHPMGRDFSNGFAVI